MMAGRPCGRTLVASRPKLRGFGHYERTLHLRRSGYCGGCCPVAWCLNLQLAKWKWHRGQTMGIVVRK
jgi:hypothetical protein